MVFKERVYSVLVVSGSEKFNSAILPLLPATDYYPVQVAPSIASAKRAVLEQSYDLILIHAPLQDDPGARFAIDVSSDRGSVVLMLAKAEHFPELTAKVSDHGIYTLSMPTSAQLLRQALGWMTTTRERLRKMEKQTVSMEEKMEEIRLVNRAKWLLIENLSMTEADAHRYIEKQAMDRCVPRREIAWNIIRTYA